jgi:hypothetical protein
LSVSNDNGDSWTNYITANGLGSNSVLSVFASDSYLYAATAGGLSVSTDNGDSWTNFTTADGLGGDFVFGVYASDGYLYAATDGGLSIAQLSGEPVPGPLPLLGAGAAFGWSRRLRRRLPVSLRRHHTGPRA